ncbi:triacylglycerol lipase [Penicillium lividum]|nr:triacylglycerol lipase [Penicillium lividum]
MGLAYADFNYHIVSDPNKIPRLLQGEGERPPPTAVLMADGWLFRSQGWDILIEIAKYAQRGGISITMGGCALHLFREGNGRSFQRHGFREAEWPWHLCAHRAQTTVTLNPASAGVVGFALPCSYIVDTISIHSVGSQDRWYDIQADEPGESAAAMSRAAHGWVGYLGNLQIGQTSVDILVCMCRIKEVTRSV